MNAAYSMPAIEVLAWTLLHFVWQGPIVAIALWCFLVLARRVSPETRYAAACTALGLMSAAVVATFGWQIAVSHRAAAELFAATSLDSDDAERVRIIGNGLNDVRLGAAGSLKLQSEIGLPFRTAPPRKRAVPPFPSEAAHRIDFQAIAARLRPWLPWIAGLWAFGVGLLSLRLLAGFRVIRNMRAEGRELQDCAWLERFDRMKQRLAVSQPVRLLSSASASIPMVIGWLKPAVLVPAGLLTSLSTAQLEAILAHELAHIRRHDYFVNLLQNVLETLLFYHPAVWWASSQIRKEREHCCDDLAAASCGGALHYARALTALAELRRAPATLGLAANGGSLIGRIRRLAGAIQPNARAREWPLVATVFVSGAATLFLASSESTPFHIWNRKSDLAAGRHVKDEQLTENRVEIQFEPETSVESLVRNPDGSPCSAARQWAKADVANPPQFLHRRKDAIWNLSLAEAIQIGLRNNGIIKAGAEFRSSRNPLVQKPDWPRSADDAALKDTAHRLEHRGVEPAPVHFEAGVQNLVRVFQTK